MNNLDRFIKAQENTYYRALNEIKNGKKITHWMWYIFPQLKGLEMSDISNYYGLNGYNEAREYLENEILGPRLYEITNEVLKLKTCNPEEVFGYVDALKLKSCMTLFDYVEPFNVLKKVLDKYYEGIVDEKTIFMCEKEKVISKRK